MVRLVAWLAAACAIPVIVVGGLGAVGVLLEIVGMLLGIFGLADSYFQLLGAVNIAVLIAVAVLSIGMVVESYWWWRAPPRHQGADD